MIYIPRHPLGDLVGSEEIDGPYSPPQTLGAAAGIVLERAAHAMVAARASESPIETILAAEFLLLFGGFLGERHMALVPQYKLGPYRFDFAVAAAEKPILFIECDGRAFHSSSEQIVHDRRKDQWALQHYGIPVLRFTGSVIHHDAAWCARCIAARIRELLQ
jgi:very-short-patch-repair endonuclease